MSAPSHSEFGGSVAARVLRCPASVRLVAKTPARLRRDTIYAQRGAALHAAMAFLIERERALDSLAGETIGEYAITRDDVENALRPALAHVDALLDQPGAEYYLEQRVAFPTIETAFGTADLIVRINGVANVVDHKFGSGVRVVARDDGGGVNPSSPSTPPPRATRCRSFSPASSVLSSLFLQSADDRGGRRTGVVHRGATLAEISTTSSCATVRPARTRSGSSP